MVPSIEAEVVEGIAQLLGEALSRDKHRPAKATASCYRSLTYIPVGKASTSWTPGGRGFSRSVVCTPPIINDL